MKLINLIFIICLIPNTLFAGRQNISIIPKPGTLGDWRASVNTELLKIQENTIELYSVKADKSCFTSESAFNACFDLTWQTGSGGDLSGYSLIDGTRAYTGKASYSTHPTFSSDTEIVDKKYVDDSIIAGGGYTDEQAQDAVGGMFTGNTETGITVTYDDATGKVNFVVATQSDTNFTSALNTKLSGIAAGAEVNVNADWNSSSGDSQILNKPTIPVASDVTYDATSWNGNTDVPTKNAVRDKIETLGGGVSLSTQNTWTATQTFSAGVVASTYSTSAADGARRSILPNNTTINPLGDGSVEIYNEAGALKAVESNTEYDILLSRDFGSTVQAYDADLATLAAPAAWRVFYSNGSSAQTALAFGTSGQVLTSNGASSAPSWTTPSGSMTWPSSAGIAVYSGSSTWSTSLTAPSGAIVGTTDTQTLTNKTYNVTSTGNDFTDVYEESITILTPIDADDPLVTKVKRAVTLTGIDCVALGGGTISADLQECDANGANCATTGATIASCGATNSNDASLTDTSIASGNWLKLVIGAPSGTVDQLAVKIYGTEVK